MSTFAIVLVVFVFWIIKAGKQAGEKANARKPEAAAQPYQPVQPAQPTPPQLGGVSEQKRVQMRNAGQWIEAKRQQDDARQLHSIKMDTCESKLESLRVLYDAGILDREEYAQRVARVKARHNER